MTVSHLGQNVVEQKQNTWSQVPKVSYGHPHPILGIGYILRKALGYQNVWNKDLSGILAESLRLKRQLNFGLYEKS